MSKELNATEVISADVSEIKSIKEFIDRVIKFHEECSEHMYYDDHFNPYLSSYIDEQLDFDGCVDEIQDEFEEDFEEFKQAVEEDISGLDLKALQKRFNEVKNSGDTNYYLTVTPKPYNEPMKLGHKVYPISKVLPLVDPEEYKIKVDYIENEARETMKGCCQAALVPDEVTFYITCGSSKKLVKEYKKLFAFYMDNQSEIHKSDLN